MTDAQILRILDVELNRAAEGLRVIEDYLRFVLDDGHLTGLIKQLRHDLSAAASELPVAQRHAARDAQADVGAAITTPTESERDDAWAVCAASFERSKQSLRSLEEYSKVVSPDLARRAEALRYRLYSLEAAVSRTVDAAARLADVRLYVLIDGGADEAQFAELASKLTAAGVGAIQLRDHRLDDAALVARARLLVRATRRAAASPDQAWSGPSSQSSSPRTLAIINNRPDVASVVDADGVHLGQDDMSAKDARAIVGPRKLIGVSTHSIEQARDAVLAGANYIGVGPIFPSPTKSFADFPGPALLRQIVAEIRLPAFAIGGISQDNVQQVFAAGARRIAVSSAVTAAADPAAAAAALGQQLLASSP